MIALMCDGLELGRFVNTEDKLTLVLDDGIEKTWLPFIFEKALDKDIDMNTVISAWKKERVFPKNRVDSFRMLRKLGLWTYNIDKICKVTRCSVITDPYWIAYETTDTYTNNSVRGQLGNEKIFPYNSMGIKEEDKYTWRI